METKSTNQSYAYIAPYNVRLSVNNTNNIFFRKVHWRKDKSTAKLIKDDITLFLNKKENKGKYRTKHGHVYQFKWFEAFVITYDDVTEFNAPQNKFKFQAVLATDYEMTFLILNYDWLLPTNAMFSGYYDPLCNKREIFAPADNTISLANESNVGKRGKHVFMLSSPHQQCTYKGRPVNRIVISEKGYKRNIYIL